MPQVFPSEPTLHGHILRNRQVHRWGKRKQGEVQNANQMGVFPVNAENVEAIVEHEKPKQQQVGAQPAVGQRIGATAHGDDQESKENGGTSSDAEKKVEHAAKMGAVWRYPDEGEGGFI